ncbi:MAG: hypothetical protein JWM90_2519 [Thermoleophilia bacterium]|nr:hypothetical protein [Thermoleophilia bacterium]
MGSRIDRALVGELLDARADAGYLSIYVGLDLEDPGRWELDLRHELEAAGLVPERGAHATPVQQTAARAMRVVHERLQVPAEVARGLVGFISIDDAATDPVWLELGEPLPNAVVIASAPYIAPLVDMWETLRPTGVIIAGRTSVTICEWNGLDLDQLDHIEADVDTTEWRRFEGPAQSGRSGQVSFADQDRFSDRLDRRRLDDLEEAIGPVLASRTRVRSWERVIWFGVSEVANRLGTRIPMSVRQVIGGDEELLNVPRSRIIEAVREAVHGDLHYREHQLIEMIRETVPARLARGVEEIEELAQQGSVDLLMLDHESPADTEGRRSIEHLIRSVYEQGGEVFAFHDESLAAETSVSAVATLRY